MINRVMDQKVNGYVNDFVANIADCSWFDWFLEKLNRRDRKHSRKTDYRTLRLNFDEVRAAGDEEYATENLPDNVDLFSCEGIRNYLDGGRFCSNCPSRGRTKSPMEIADIR